MRLAARFGLSRRFDYAPSGDRVREWGSDGEVALFGGLERRYSPAAQGNTYVTGNTVVTQTGAKPTASYLLTDRLGSVDAITNAAGSLLETRGFR